MPPSCSASADDRKSDAEAAACGCCCSDRDGRVSVIIRTVHHEGSESRGGTDQQQFADRLACSLRRHLTQQLNCPASGGPAVVVVSDTIAADRVVGSGQCDCDETARGSVIQVIVTRDNVETSCNDDKQMVSGADDSCCDGHAPRESSTCERPTREIRQERGPKELKPCSVEMWDLPNGGVKVTVTQAVDTSCNDDEPVMTGANDTCCGEPEPRETSTCHRPPRKSSTCKRPKRKNRQHSEPIKPRPCSVETWNLRCVDEAPQDDTGLGCMDSRRDACDRQSESYDRSLCVHEFVCDEPAAAEATNQQDCHDSGVQEDELDEWQVEDELALLDKRRAYLLRVLEECDQPVVCNNTDEGAQQSR